MLYLPLWNDTVVGGSKWRNNTHAELGNRARKQLLKEQNQGCAMRIDDYVDLVIVHNIGKQQFWLSRLRYKHAVNVSNGVYNVDGAKARQRNQCQIR